MKNLVNRFVREEEGQDLIEYSLLAALIAVACIAAMQALAIDINEIFTKIGAALDAAYQFRFSPGKQRETPVRCTVAIPFRFHLMNVRQEHGGK